ncbi:MAG: internal scaffolding protein [Microviridae sp.]|nr:MAG: internal scaffolding protein [Microviridae sp.]
MKKLDKIIPFRTPYEPRKPCFFNTTGESLTQQHFQEECDIINIIKRHDRNGIIEHVHRGQARYGDFSEVQDYREALDLVRNAQEEFMTIPSDIRKQFDNNPGKFYEFVSNPENKNELEKMGFIQETPKAVAPSSATDPIPESGEPSTAQERSE